MSGLIDVKCLYDAFIFMNEQLFHGELEVPVIGWHRHKGAYGYFRPEGYEERAEKDDRLITHEIALNPDNIKGRSDKKVLSTLVHEMVHQWQQVYGKPPRKGYHNRQWADKMEDVGLIPSDTAQPGGKRTGQKVSHYFVDGALFDKTCDRLLETGWSITWQGRPQMKEAKKSNKDKIKYLCFDCDIRAWAKDGVALICGACGQEMKPEGI